VHEIKHDGYRLIARKDAGRVNLWSRYATDYSDTFSRTAEAVRALPVDRVVLDGEAVVFRPDGHSDFVALRTNRGAAQASLVTFDLLQFEGEDWRKLPLEVRRAQQDSLVAGIDGLTFSEALDADGAVVFAHACKLGLEGIISKRLGGLYASGRCRNWLKVKNPDFERRSSMRDHAHMLSDFRAPTLSIECEPCGRRGRYNVARLMEKYGDAKLPELRHVLANCPKAHAHSIHRCRVHYSEDSRPGDLTPPPGDHERRAPR
jgi:bifunctional non-homologous end joining protein LigD